MKRLYKFSIASFLNDAGSDMITAVIPVVIKSFGGTDIHIGVASAIREGLPLVFNYFSSIISKKIGKMKVVLGGYSLSSIAKFLMAFSTNLLFFLSALTLDRVGKGIRDPPRDKILSEIYEKEKIKAFSIHQALDTLGSLFGTLLVLFLISRISISDILLLGAAISSFSIIPLLSIKVKEIKEEERLDKGIWEVFLLGLPMVGVVVPLSYLALEEMVKMFVLFNLIFVLTSLVVARLKVKDTTLMSFAYVTIILAFISFYFSAPILGFSLLGISQGVFKPSVLSYISGEEKSMKGFATAKALLGLGIISGNLLSGFLLELFNKKAFLYLSLLGGGLLLWTLKRIR